jgi:hypothetical protein
MLTKRTEKRYIIAVISGFEIVTTIFVKSLLPSPAYRPRSRPRTGQAGFALRGRSPSGAEPEPEAGSETKGRNKPSLASGP